MNLPLTCLIYFVVGLIVGYIARSYSLKKKFKKELQYRAPKVKNPRTKK